MRVLESAVAQARCVTCGKSVPIEGTVSTCSSCGPIRGTLEIGYDLERLRTRFTPAILRERTDPTIWRFSEILPIRASTAIVPVPVGGTPLSRLETDLGFRLPRSVWVKDETRNPSGSAKDRATAVGVARANEIGARVVAAASTGNAASSLALFAARAQLECQIFAPSSAPLPKLTQIRAYGARLFSVAGSYDDAFDLCVEVCDRFGFYNRSSAINPFLSEGKKTIALEVWEQLGYRAPDALILPVGDGCILGGIAKGFSDLHRLHRIESVPKLIGVQARGASALADAWKSGAEECTDGRTETVADSIAVSKPRDQIKALRAIRDSNGAFVTVSDEAMLKAVAALASRAGFLVEPGSAAALAGLEAALESGFINDEDEVVLVLTGHGLKDVASLSQAVAWNEPVTVKPNLAAVEKALASGRTTWTR